MAGTPPQMNIDNCWVPALESKFGYVGHRIFCQIGQIPGNPEKNLLLRLPLWQGSQVEYSRIAKGSRYVIRPVAEKTYDQRIPLKNGEYSLPQSVNVFQQDVTGLQPLKGAILQALREGKPERIWELYYQVCTALDDYAKATEPGSMVALQCPDSLAVGPNNQIVLLDAEFRVLGLAPEPVQKRYHMWFREDGKSGYAGVADASFLHARAILAYFKHLLDPRNKNLPADGAVVAQKAVTQLDQLHEGMNLGAMKEVIEDWGIELPEEAVSALPFSPLPLSLPPEVDREDHERPRSRWALLLSLLLNLVLFLLLIAAGIFLGLQATSAAKGPMPAAGVNNPQPGQQGQQADPLRPVAEALPADLYFSSYCVVFPSQDATPAKVSEALAKLFKNKTLPVLGTVDDQQKLQEGNWQEIHQSLKEQDKLVKLLTRENNKGSITFEGFKPGVPPEQALREVFNLLGMVKIGGRYYSILETRGLEKILENMDSGNRAEARKLLLDLKRAIHEYTSFKDALNMSAGRPAFLIRVEPTAAAHQKVREELLKQTGELVFLSHPIPQIFDGKDLKYIGDIQGPGVYSLTLDRKCYWRLVCKEDRPGIDFSKIKDKERFEWKSFDKSHKITWRPISLKKGKKVETLASFDIGLVVGNQVVVFRNQRVFLGESEKDVEALCKDYLQTDLKLPNLLQDFKQAVRITGQKNEFTGTISYNFLADRVTPEIAASSQCLEVRPIDDFLKSMQKENKVLR